MKRGRRRVRGGRSWRSREFKKKWRVSAFLRTLPPTAISRSRMSGSGSRGAVIVRDRVGVCPLRGRELSCNLRVLGVLVKPLLGREIGKMQPVVLLGRGDP